MTELREKITEEILRKQILVFLNQVDEDLKDPLHRSTGSQYPVIDLPKEPGGRSGKGWIDEGAFGCQYGSGRLSNAPYTHWHNVSIYYDVTDGWVKVGIRHEDQKNYKRFDKFLGVEYLQASKMPVDIYYRSPRNNIDFTALYTTFIDLCENVMRYRYSQGEMYYTKYFGKESLEEIKTTFAKMEAEMTSSCLVGEDKQTWAKIRINQSAFRDLLLKKYAHCCLCNVTLDSLLVASHIKPWCDSSPEERVDENNGLLLCPNHDKLFDQGFISFDNEGKILISHEMEMVDRIFMNVREDMVIFLSEEMRRYMEYHRKNIYRG